MRNARKFTTIRSVSELLLILFFILVRVPIEFRVEGCSCGVGDHGVEQAA